MTADRNSILGLISPTMRHDPLGPGLSQTKCSCISPKAKPFIPNLPTQNPSRTEMHWIFADSWPWAARKKCSLSQSVDDSRSREQSYDPWGFGVQSSNRAEASENDRSVSVKQCQIPLRGPLPNTTSDATAIPVFESPRTSFQSIMLDVPGQRTAPIHL